MTRETDDRGVAIISPSPGSTLKAIAIGKDEGIDIALLSQSNANVHSARTRPWR
jgi:hypothetical protein